MCTSMYPAIPVDGWMAAICARYAGDCDWLVATQTAEAKAIQDGGPMPMS